MAEKSKLNTEEIDQKQWEFVSKRRRGIYTYECSISAFCFMAPGEGEAPLLAGVYARLPVGC